MKVADFGCGVGLAKLVSRMLAEIVGPAGRVVGIDASAEQVVQAANLCRETGLDNTAFVAADATNTELPRESFDLAIASLLPLSAAASSRSRGMPAGNAKRAQAGRRYRCRGWRPGYRQQPSTYRAGRFRRFVHAPSGPTRGVDYSVASRLHQMVKAAGFPNPKMRIHQPAIAEGENRFLLKWSVEEAGSAFVSAGLITPEQLKRTLTAMQAATDDPEVVVLMPRLSAVWARKPASTRGSAAARSRGRCRPGVMRQRPSVMLRSNIADSGMAFVACAKSPEGKEGLEAFANADGAIAWPGERSHVARRRDLYNPHWRAEWETHPHSLVRSTS
jgi:hypothetical protein